MPIQNIQAYNVPINLSNDIFPNADGQITESSLWGNQDIALPGESDGDGVVDNGAIPLRMILQPTNAAEYTVKASEIYMEAFDGYPDGPLNTVNPYISAGKYEPTSIGYEDNLYPGYTGGSVNVRTWVNGASTTLTDGTATTINLWPNGQTIYSKVKIFDFDFSTNSAGTPGAVGNTVVVLAYINPEHDILTNTAPVFLSANELTTNDMSDGLVAYKLYIGGSATPITTNSNSGNTNVTTLTDNSWTLTVEASQGYQANFSVIPYLPGFSMFNGSSGTYNGYGYQTNWIPQEPFRAGITFSPSNIWQANSYALPEAFGDLKSIFFWLVPNQGYVLSRHNVSVNQMAGTGETTYFDYGLIGEYTGTSNATLDIGYRNTTNDVFGTNVSQGYVMDWTNSFPSSIGQLIDYDQVTDHPYETFENGFLGTPFTQTSSFRGATKYFNVNATVSSNYNDLSEQSQNLNTIFVPTDSSEPAIRLIDSKQYTKGIPILGQFINSVPAIGSSIVDWMLDDNGAEYVNNVTPEQYCTSDWIGNSVLVNFTYLHNYIPGANPNNIKITIDGAATAFDGEQCLPFSVDLIGGVDIITNDSA